MTGFQIQYMIFGTYVIVSGMCMVLVYSLTNPWWRSHLGRMMVTYAGAEICMSALLMITVEFQVSPHWFRAVWFALQTVVGSVLVFQTHTILKLHREAVRRAQKGDGS